jgi:glycerol-3-phosphate cytidylyltransferase-like family protein
VGGAARGIVNLRSFGRFLAKRAMQDFAAALVIVILLLPLVLMGQSAPNKNDRQRMRDEPSAVAIDAARKAERNFWIIVIGQTSTALALGGFVIAWRREKRDTTKARREEEERQDKRMEKLCASYFWSDSVQDSLSKKTDQRFERMLQMKTDIFWQGFDAKVDARVDGMFSRRVEKGDFVRTRELEGVERRLDERVARIERDVSTINEKLDKQGEESQAISQGVQILLMRNGINPAEMRKK